MKKMKANVKGKPPADTSKFAKIGLNMQSQSSPKTRSTRYIEKVKLFEWTINDIRMIEFHSVYWITICVLIRLLDVKLIKMITFVSLINIKRISTREFGVHIILMHWVIIQIAVRHLNIKSKILSMKDTTTRENSPKTFHMLCAISTDALAFPGDELVLLKYDKKMLPWASCLSKTFTLFRSLVPLCANNILVVYLSLQSLLFLLSCLIPVR